MALLTDIKNNNWQVSVTGSGNVVEGINDVRQCLDILLRTQKGSDPLRPLFGSDIYQQLDRPINSVIPNVKRAIIEAVAMFEKRVKIVSIKHQVIGSNIQFFVTYNLIDDDLVDNMQLLLNNDGFVITPVIAGRFIVEAEIPDYGIFQLLLQFIVDGKSAVPVPPVTGFSSAQIMFNWVLANWSFFGNWYLLPDRLVLYINPGMVKEASLKIGVTEIFKYSAPIPVVEPGQNYVVVFSPQLIQPVTETVVPGGLADILNFVKSNYPDVGTWALEPYDGIADFAKIDFVSPDFNIKTLYQLVLYTTIFPGAILEISTQ